MPQFSYMLDQILGKEWKHSIFRPKFTLFYGPPLPEYKDMFKNFTYDQMSYVMDQEYM